MKARLEDKYKAIRLRKMGLTYRDIMKEIPVSKSLLSGWFRFLELTDEEEELLRQKAKENKDKGNTRAALSNREKRKEREKAAYKAAEEIFNEYKDDPAFYLGIGLYWAEGSKRASGWQFVNSSPNIIKFMIFWIKEYLGIDSERIFIRIHTHEDFKTENYEVFWQNTLKILPNQLKRTCYKPNTRHGIFKKNPQYKGCVRIEVSRGISELRKTLSLISILENNLEKCYAEQTRP